MQVEFIAIFFMFLCICIGVAAAASNKNKSSSSSIGGKHPVPPPRRIVTTRVDYDTFCLKCGKLIRAGHSCRCY